MKLTILFLFIALTANAQYVEHETDIDNAINVYMRGGYAFNTSSPQLGGGFVARSHNIGMAAELNIPWSDTEAKEFGIRLSYKLGAFEAGYGRYMLLFTTDKYDQDKNGYGNMFFVSYHKNLYRQNWFIEADYMNGFRLTLGVNGLISKL